MKHIGWIIILLGAVVICLTGCKSKPEVSVELTPNHGWRILIDNDRENDHRILQNRHGLEFALFIEDRNEAILFAKQFDTWDKIKHWQDSVKSINNPSLLKSEVKRETITIY